MAGVIKGNRPREGERAADDSGSNQARAILAEAQRSAAALLEETRQQVAQGVKDAAALGQQEGFSQAEHMREQIRGLEQRMLKEVEGEVVRTALKVAEELLLAELTQRTDAIVDLAVTALNEARTAREVFLRVHPSQAEVLRAQKSRLVDTLSIAKDVDVREDRKVSRGGVLIQTESGVIDATLETQLAELARVLGA